MEKTISKTKITKAVKKEKTKKKNPFCEARCPICPRGICILLPHHKGPHFGAPCKHTWSK